MAWSTVPSTVGLLQFYTAVFFWSMGPFSRCVGETSFGNMPDACSATPFTFRHTYRCDGVNDPRWNGTLGGCVFVPKVKLRDNWYWCTGTPAGGRNPQGPEFCDDKPEAWVEFSGQVIVSG